MRDPFLNAREMTSRFGPYVADLRRLLVFHGAKCGAANDFEALEAKLANSDAFRTDLSAMVRQIRDLEGEQISATEMLTLIALASGGEDLVDGRADSIAPAKTVAMLRTLLAGVGGWEGGVRPRFDHHIEGDPVREEEPRVSAREAQDHPTDAAASVVPPTAAPASSQARLELAIAELKVYLDDIDRRIGRLEPRLEDITQIMHQSADRKIRPEALAEGPGAVAASERSASASADPEAPASAAADAPAVLIHRFSPREEPEPQPTPLPDPPSEAVSGGIPPLLPQITAPSQPGWRAASQHAQSVTAYLRSGTTRETIGRLLGLVAVLLMAVGIVTASLAFLRPQHDVASAQNNAQQDDTLQDKEQSAQASPPVLQGSPAPVNYPPASAAAVPPAVGAASKMEVVPRTRVAGKRSEIEPAEPGVEDLRPVPPKLQHEALAKAPVALSSPTSRSNTPVTSSAVAGGKPLVQARPAAGATLLTSRTPAYPTDALRDHREGTVVLDALIAKDGTVRRMDVVQGTNGFTRSALDAVWQWRYKPHQVHGAPAEMQTRITVEYRIH